jgi:hypothetical protein
MFFGKQSGEVKDIENSPPLFNFTNVINLCSSLAPVQGESDSRGGLTLLLLNHLSHPFLHPSQTEMGLCRIATQ